MPKFYVTSGDLKRIIDRPDAKTAAVDSFKSMTSESVNIVTMVSERGFDSETDQDLFFYTMDILEASDKLDGYE